MAFFWALLEFLLIVCEREYVCWSVPILKHLFSGQILHSLIHAQQPIALRDGPRGVFRRGWRRLRMPRRLPARIAPATCCDLIVSPVARPFDAVFRDQIVRSAWEAPVPHGRPHCDGLPVEFQAPIRRMEREHDLLTASAGAPMRGRRVFT